MLPLPRNVFRDVGPSRTGPVDVGAFERVVVALRLVLVLTFAIWGFGFGRQIAQPPHVPHRREDGVHEEAVPSRRVVPAPALPRSDERSDAPAAALAAAPAALDDRGAAHELRPHVGHAAGAGDVLAARRPR